MIRSVRNNFVFVLFSVTGLIAIPFASASLSSSCCTSSNNDGNCNFYNGQYIASPNGNYVAGMKNGIFGIYYASNSVHSIGSPLWTATPAVGHTLAAQNDRNLVVYSESGSVVWALSTYTWSSRVCCLSISDLGLLTWAEKDGAVIQRYPLVPGTSQATGDGTIVRGPWKFSINNKAGDRFAQNIRQRIIDTFFHVYPQIQPKYNPQATQHVKLTVDPDYDGVASAHAAAGEMTISLKYLERNPQDIDWVAHEGMHIIQNYHGAQPGWLVEGIADFVRWRYGLDNAAAGWKLPDLDQGRHHYSDAYGVTARFLAWLERNVKENVVEQIDSNVRQNRYQNGALWNQLFGKSVDQLWNDYKNNPSIKEKEDK